MRGGRLDIVRQAGEDHGEREEEDEFRRDVSAEVGVAQAAAHRLNDTDRRRLRSAVPARKVAEISPRSPWTAAEDRLSAASRRHLGGISAASRRYLGSSMKYTGTYIAISAIRLTIYTPATWRRACVGRSRRDSDDLGVSRRISGYLGARRFAGSRTPRSRIPRRSAGHPRRGWCRRRRRRRSTSRG